jgi:hypothetical protein
MLMDKKFSSSNELKNNKNKNIKHVVGNGRDFGDFYRMC